jgi:probable rRNA maturation factor
MSCLSFTWNCLHPTPTGRPSVKPGFFSQPATGLNGERPLLGEVIISTPTARCYAERHALTCAEEIQRLVIHGIIHLCGYDHETDTGQMTRLERRLRRRFLHAATNAPPAHQP